MSKLAITIVPATPDQLHAVIELLDNTAQWLQSHGIYQWESPPPVSFIAFMQEETAAGHVYLAWTGQGDPPCATFRIAHDDMPRWQDDSGDNAIYVYSLAIRNDMHGLDIGAVVLNAVCEMASRQDKVWLRLDCWARNTRLQRYYTELGFTQVSEVNDNGFPLTLFQVQVSSGKRLFAETTG